MMNGSDSILVIGGKSRTPWKIIYRGLGLTLSVHFGFIIKLRGGSMELIEQNFIITFKFYAKVSSN